MKTEKPIRFFLAISLCLMLCKSFQLERRILVDENCQDWNSAECRCNQCKEGYWYDRDEKLCKWADCKTFCYQTGKCLSCDRCYALVDGQCWPTPCAPPCEETSDENCLYWDTGSYQCQCYHCRQGYWYDSIEFLCKLPNPTCAQFQYDTGQCTACIQCYALVQGQCLPTPGAPFFCVKCEEREWYNSETQLCQVVNEKCWEFNLQNGHCTSCQDPSQNVDDNGQCVLVEYQEEEIFDCQMTDSNCYQWNYDACECKVCSGHFWFDQDSRKCERVSDLCKQYNPNNGHCESCWDQELQIDEDGACSQVNDPAYGADCNWKDVFCNQFDSQGCCIKCSHRYYFDDEGECTAVSQQCNEYNEDTGECTSCYWGYHQIDGECVRN